MWELVFINNKGEKVLYNMKSMNFIYQKDIILNKTYRNTIFNLWFFEKNNSIELVNKNFNNLKSTKDIGQEISQEAVEAILKFIKKEELSNE